MADLPAADLFPQITHVHKKAFLSAFTQYGRLLPACRQLDMHHSQHYYWLKTDPAYVAAFAQAKEYAIDVLEDVAHQRATSEDRPSDTLLIFLLKAARPDKYRDNARKDERQDISDLLKAVLLELADRHTLPAPAQEAEWAPLPPSERMNGQNRRALPEPPGIDEEG